MSPLDTTVHLPAEGRFAQFRTRELLTRAVERLRDGSIILSDGETDYAAADLLALLGALHDTQAAGQVVGDGVETLWQVRQFCIAILDRGGA